MPVTTSTGGTSTGQTGTSARAQGRPERADARTARTARVRPGAGRHPGRGPEQAAGPEQADGIRPEQRRPGRPRSEQADQAIMTAALDLFAESGPAGLCIEQVAARAGVGKATIYRRWPGKEDMLLDALPLLASALPVPQGRSVRADLIALLDATCKEAADPRRRRLIALLQGEGVQYPRLKASYLAAVIQPRREAFRTVLRRGVATGELREDTDIDAAMYLLNGAVVASMSGMHADLVDSRYARRVVAELLRGLGAR
jgi:AcrR family transcriptional regulator